MKNYLLSIMVIVGVSLASTGNTNERIKIFGIDTSETVKEAVGHLETIGLYCDRSFSSRSFKHILCHGGLTDQDNNLVSVAMLSSYKDEDKVLSLTLSCITFAFCSEYGPWHLSEQLKSNGVVRSWTTSLRRETTSYSQSVQQKKQYAFQRDEVTLRNTNTITYATYCDASGGVELCIFEKPDHSYMVEKAEGAIDETLFYGPVLQLLNIGEYEVDFNPKQWKESGLFLGPAGQ